MTATIISNNTPFGQMTHSVISRLIALNTQMVRLGEAVATASSGYTGTDGTQFETSPMGGPANNFGVQPGDTPGAKGTDYAYAIDSLLQQWQPFWTAARPYIEQLDNGVSTM